MLSRAPSLGCCEAQLTTARSRLCFKICSLLWAPIDSTAVMGQSGVAGSIRTRASRLRRGYSIPMDGVGAKQRSAYETPQYARLYGRKRVGENRWDCRISPGSRESEVQRWRIVDAGGRVLGSRSRRRHTHRTASAAGCPNRQCWENASLADLAVTGCLQWRDVRDSCSWSR